MSTVISSRILDECYIQFHFSQLKGFLDVGRPPFFKFHEKMNISYSHFPLCLNIYISNFMYEIFIFISHIIWLCGSSTQEFSSPRLEYGGEFLLHHQDRVNWFLLARFFIIQDYGRSFCRPWWLDFPAISRPMQWIVKLVLKSLLVRVSDEHFLGFISSWVSDGYTHNLGFILSYALDGWTLASFLA